MAPASTNTAIASRGQRLVILLLLTTIYALAFIDRQIVNILAEPIKQELGLADWEIGVLAGPAFALFYALGAIPLARLSERWNRVYILSALLAIWSGFTALSGFATSFFHLLLVRIGVGAAESGCVPAAQSLISDSVPREERATALALFSTGLPLGSLLGLAIGGIVAHHFDWRTAFFIVGLPGIILALMLVIFVRDPRQTLNASHTSSVASQQPEVPPLLVVLKILWTTRSFTWMLSGATILSIAGYGHMTFYASFFLRNHASELESLASATNMGGPIAFLGLSLGLAVGLTGAIGTALGGRLGDWRGVKKFRDYMLVPTLATAIGTPITIGALLIPSVPGALGLFAFAALLKSMWIGPVFATFQSLVSSRARATAVSVFLLVMNGVGLGLGPVILGAMSDFLGGFMASGDALRWAMVSTTILIFFAVICFAMAWRTLPDEPVS